MKTVVTRSKVPRDHGTRLRALAVGIGLGAVALVALILIAVRARPRTDGPVLEVSPGGPPPPTGPPAPPPELQQEVRALEGWKRLARPTVDLVAWSRDPEAREDDCALMLPLPRSGDAVTLRPGAACEVLAVNGTPISGALATQPLAFPPFRAGLNWVRVRSTLPRAVLGSAEVPEDRAWHEQRGDTPDAERVSYAGLRHVLYPPGEMSGQDRAGALAVLDQLPPGEGGIVLAYGQAWVDLACGLADLGHGSPVAGMLAAEGTPLWHLPKTRAVSRTFLDRIQAQLERHPHRDYLWLGLAWQLRWGEAWDAARAGFAQALALEPRAGWTWFEMGRWESELALTPLQKDPRTRPAIERDELEHFRLARVHLTGHDQEPGLLQILRLLDANIARLGKPRH